MTIPFFEYNEKPNVVEQPYVVEQFLSPIKHQSNTIQQEVFIEPLLEQMPVFAFRWIHLLMAIYVLVTLILLIRFGYNLFTVFRRIKSSEKITVEGTSVLKHKDMASSSFFHFVFLGEKIQKTEELKWILAHEKAHVQGGHAIDLMIMNVLVIFQWFNPLVRLFRKELCMVHEYLADAQVTQNLPQKKSYARFMALSTQPAVAHTHMHSFRSFTKKRLIMLYKSSSSATNIWRYLLISPLTLLLFSALGRSHNANISQEIIDKIGSLEQRKIITVDAPGVKENIRLKWGDLEIEMGEGGPVMPSGTNSYYKHVKVSKSKFYEVLDNPLKIFQGNNRLTLKHSKATVSLKSPWRKETKNYVNDIDIKLRRWHKSDVLNELRKEIGNNRLFYFKTTMDDYWIHLTIELDDPETAENYVQFGDVKCTMQEVYYPEIPMHYITYVNKTNAEDLVSYLSDDISLVAKDGNISYDGANINFYLAEGPSRQVNKEELFEYLKSEKQLKVPLIMEVTQDDGENYLLAFEEKESTAIEYDDWMQYKQEKFFLPVGYSVDEQVEFNWGPIKIYATNDIILNGHYFGRFGFQRIINGSLEAKISFEDLQSALEASPKLQSSKYGSENNLTLLIAYIDHLALPLHGKLVYENGELVEGHDLLQQILDRRKAKDFITVEFRNNTTGQIIAGSGQIKLYEDKKVTD